MKFLFPTTQYDFSTDAKLPHDFNRHLEYVYTKFPYNTKPFVFTRTANSRLIYSGGETIHEIFHNGREEHPDIMELGGIRHALVKVMNLPVKYIEELKLADFKESAKMVLEPFWDDAELTPKNVENQVSI